jgi:Bacterial HORMA domain family 1
MSNSYTVTNTQTFTISNAQYLASRIAADLSIVKGYYGQLTDQQILDFSVEAAVLLYHGLLDNVKYGFQSGEQWVYALLYKVNHLNQLELASDAPGGISFVSLPAGATWHSSLTSKSSDSLSDEQVAEIKAALPVQRVTGAGPGTALGSWSADKNYGVNGVGLGREQFRLNS